jgi:DNA-binding transcriptional ArsR family regulator
MKTSMTDAAPAFAALGDSTRLALVMRLSHEGPLSIARLTGRARITRQAVTKHLRILEQARLISSERAGRERLWQLRQNRLKDVRGYLDQISGQWDAALERLRAMVESGE